MGTKYGGISAVNYQMATEMAKTARGRFEIYVLISDPKSTISDEEVEKVRQSVGVNLVFPLIERAKVIRVSRCPEIDVVIAHGDVSGPYSMLLKALSQFSSSRIWFFNHTDPKAVDPYKGPMQQRKGHETGDKVKRLIDIAAQCQRVFSVGKSIFNSWERAYNGANLSLPHRIYYPQLNSFFFRDLPPMKRDEPSSIRILIFARVDESTMYFKGVDIACLIARKLAEKLSHITDVELVVRGIPADELFKNFTEVTRRSQGKVRVLPLEYGTQEDIRADLYSSDLCIVPARYEPYGLTGLEAIAAKTPVLVSRNTGLALFLQELCGMTEWIVDGTYDMTNEKQSEEAAGKFAELAAKILDTSQRKFTRQKVEALHKRVCDLFQNSEEKVISYEQLIAMAHSNT